VALIHVVDGGLQTQGLQGSNAAYTQNHLLLDAMLVIASIELIGDPSVFGLVFPEVRVEEIERHPSDVSTPYLCLHGAARKIYLDETGAAAQTSLQAYGQVIEVILGIQFLLPPIRVEILAEVSLLV
jgi:hypothetical protein